MGRRSIYNRILLLFLRFVLLPFFRPIFFFRPVFSLFRLYSLIFCLSNIYILPSRFPLVSSSSSSSSSSSFFRLVFSVLSRLVFFLLVSSSLASLKRVFVYLPVLLLCNIYLYVYKLCINCV
jgi:hypothetical protein